MMKMLLVLCPFFFCRISAVSRVADYSFSIIHLLLFDRYQLFFQMDIIVAVKRAAASASAKAKAVSSTQELLVDLNGVITPFSTKRLARFKAFVASFERSHQQLTSLVTEISKGDGKKGSTPGSPIYMIIDLGCSPECRSLSPFLAKEQGVGGHFDGDADMGCFYFEVEAYTSSSGKPTVLKRRKAPGGDFIHGGQFEHLLQACSLQRDTSRMMGVGFCVNIDILVSYYPSPVIF